MAEDSFVFETVKLADLKPHPRNYRKHPPDQIAHLRARLRKFGFYRNIVVGQDNTILAGHGIAEAAREEGYELVPAKIMDVDPYSPKGLELLAGDNEVDRLSENDDRALADILKEVRDNDADALLGTGFDDPMLANLVYITRPATEIGSKDAAAEWVGLPEYEPAPNAFKVVVNCETIEDRDAFLEHLKVTSIQKNTRGTLSIWWPLREREHVTPLRFEVEEDPVDEVPGIHTD